MVGVTVLGLFLTPVFYVAIRQAVTRLRRKKGGDGGGSGPKGGGGPDKPEGDAPKDGEKLAAGSDPVAEKMAGASAKPSEIRAETGGRGAQAVQRADARGGGAPEPKPA